MNRKLLYMAVARYKSKKAFYKSGKKRFWSYRQRPHRRKTSHDLRYQKHARETMDRVAKAVEAWAEFHKMLAQHTAPKEVGAIMLRGPQPGQTVVTHEELRWKHENLALNYDTGLPAILRYPKGLTEAEQKEKLAEFKESIKKG